MNIRLITLFCYISFLYLMNSSLVYSQDEYKKELQGAGYGNDPFGYKQADSMYSIANTLLFDKTANLLINKISNNIDKNLLIEQNIIWNDLIKLEPYRKTIEVQNIVKIWSSKTAKLIAVSKINKSVDLDQFISMYKNQGSSKELSDYGRKLLLENPTSLDLRNNFALCQMHLNLDLTSQVELEILKCYDSTYLPSLINLTVIYERLGKTSEAKKLSKDLLSKRNDIPIILFNAAWYHNLDSNFNTAETLLKKANDLDITGKYQSFYQLNSDQLQNYYWKKHGFLISCVLLIVLFIICFFLIRSLKKKDGCFARGIQILLLIIFVFVIISLFIGLFRL